MPTLKTLLRSADADNRESLWKPYAEALLKAVTNCTRDHPESAVDVWSDEILPHARALGKTAEEVKADAAIIAKFSLLCESCSTERLHEAMKRDRANLMVLEDSQEQLKRVQARIDELYTHWIEGQQYLRRIADGRDEVQRLIDGGPAFLPGGYADQVPGHCDLLAPLAHLIDFGNPELVPIGEDDDGEREVFDNQAEQEAPCPD